MKYSVGQKVKIRSLEWYRDDVNRYGIIECGKYEFFEPMNEYCGKVVTIKRIDDDNYRIDADKGAFCWTDEMIEGLVEEENANYSKVIDNGASNPIIAKTSSATIDTDKGFYSYSSDGNLEMEWNLPDGYIFKDENGNVINATKIVLEKKKKEYPKTYEECCDVLKIPNHERYIDIDVPLDYNKLFYAFTKLIICRDAYWKIAGEEMGLGKPWEPDWAMYSGPKHCIIYSDNEIKWQGKHFVTEAKVLAFPTEEMRDAFYENFKELIEQCKELL